MLRKCTSFGLVAASGAILCTGATAKAQVIVQTFTIPTNTVSYSTSENINLFNSTLGTLNSVTLDLSTSITADIQVFNGTGLGYSFTAAEASVPVQAIGPAGTLTTTAVTPPINGTVTAAFGVTNFPGQTATADNSITLTSTPNLAAYTGFGGGTSSIAVNGILGTYFLVNGTPSGIAIFGSATAGGTLTLTYNYTKAAVLPEPGVTSMFAAGVLGSLGMVIRRRRKK